MLGRRRARPGITFAVARGGSRAFNNDKRQSQPGSLQHLKHANLVGYKRRFLHRLRWLVGRQEYFRRQRINRSFDFSPNLHANLQRQRI